jgi:hypothetical protein
MMPMVVVRVAGFGRFRRGHAISPDGLAALMQRKVARRPSLR